MTAVSMFCYALLLIAPALTLRSGLHYKRIAATPNAPKAYPSHVAVPSPSGWTYAQNLAAVRLMIAGIVMAVLAIAFMAMMPASDTHSTLICAGIALGIEIVILLCFMTSIEMSLQSRFKAS